MWWVFGRGKPAAGRRTGGRRPEGRERLVTGRHAEKKEKPREIFREPVLEPMNEAATPKEKPASVEDAAGYPDGALLPNMPLGSAVQARLQEEVFESDIVFLQEYKGEVYSAEGSKIPFNPEQRLLAAYLEEGVFVYSRADAVHPAVLQARQEIVRRGFAIAREMAVDAATIRLLYEQYDERKGKKQRARSVTPMQERFLALVTEVAERGGSDIHLEIGRTEGVVRVRIDGAMRRWRDLPASEAHNLAAAAFNMSDSSDATYRPLDYQGARITKSKTPLPPGVMSLRLQFNPLPQGGRYMVVRLLYENNKAMRRMEGERTLMELGMLPWNINDLRSIMNKPFGVNIVSGPTGSGKSTTLQAVLSMLWRERRKRIAIETIEDPPEYVIDGAAQFPVVNALTEEERREKFRQAIVAVLRSDPDIIMIGELRDGVSARLCFEGAMTGHGVYTSLHANDALSIVGRLIDLGVESYKLADETLCTGLIAQRLVRKVCPQCGLTVEDMARRGGLDRRLLSWLDALPVEWESKIRFVNEDGCPNCVEGVVGRVALFETVATDAHIMELLTNHKKNQAREYWLRHLGGVTMREAGALRVFEGVVDPQDVMAVAGDLAGVPLERVQELMARRKQLEEEAERGSLRRAKAQHVFS